MLVEILIGAILMLVVGTVLVGVITIAYDSQRTISGQNLADATARAAMDSLVDNLRTASADPAGSNSVLSAAAINDITYYGEYYNTASPPALVFYTVRYWVDSSVSPATLKQTVVENGVTTTTRIAQGVSSLTLTYYTAGGAYNAPSASWVTTANPNSPTAAEMPSVGAIGITVTVTTSNGYARTLSSFVRLINSPIITRV